MCCGTEAGAYSRLVDTCITQLKAQGPSRTCNESKEEEDEFAVSTVDRVQRFLAHKKATSPRFLRADLTDLSRGASPLYVGGGVRIHPENARMSGRHGVQHVRR